MPEAWKQGATGAGMVYGVIDSGAQWTHPALREAYRGTNRMGADHDYNWMDFEGSSPMPIDARGHGTHVTGTGVGRTAAAQIGVAPDAKFIVARGTGTGRIDSALRALQWMQAPTKRDGSAPNPAKAPDVVGMSWWMGSSREELFRDSIQNLRLAGIEPVKSAGNKGDGPETITSPGHFPEIYAVAAVDKNGKVADFSSRGNALIPVGNPVAKPDFAAPGVAIMSSLPGDLYGENNGTSMAQPHFSGALLAILSKYPQLTHDQLTQVLAAGATDAGPAGRDTAYGQGVINVPRSLQAAAQLLAGSEVTVTPTRPAPAVAA
jgi:bacillopeptidase F